MTRPLGFAAWLVAATALGAGCVGEVGGGGPGDPGVPPPVGGGNPGPGPIAGPVNGFQPPKAQLKLLPFSIRLGRISTVTGLPLTDPAFNTLRDNRLQLGDHDYANAKPPQESWSAARLTLWVESLRPVCQSAVVQTKFAPMPGKLPLLVEAAYGRGVLPDDSVALTDGLKGLSVSPAKVVEATCLSIFSSLEFVAQ